MLTELHEARMSAVMAALAHGNARSVMDLGCGSGTLLTRLLADARYERILGKDRSGIAVQEIRRHADVVAAEASGRLVLLAGSYLEFDPRLQGYDAATMVESIEHLDPGHLSQVESTVLVRYRPGILIVTTPNVEFNELYGLAPGTLRDPDHRFEWSRAKFRQWANGVAQRCGYRTRFAAIGPLHPDLGSPTQMAIFERVDAGD